jgi:hypothetical protein
MADKVVLVVELDAQRDGGRIFTDPQKYFEAAGAV